MGELNLDKIEETYARSSRTGNTGNAGKSPWKMLARNDEIPYVLVIPGRRDEKKPAVIACG